MSRSAKRILAVAVLCCVAIAAFYAGRRSAPEQVDVFTWLLWLRNSHGVYQQLAGEPSIEKLDAARQQLLMAMDTAAGVLQEHPQTVKARFGDNSAAVFEMVEQVEPLVTGEIDRSRWTSIAVDADNQVVGIYPDLNLEATEKEAVNVEVSKEAKPVGGENPPVGADTSL